MAETGKKVVRVCCSDGVELEVEEVVAAEFAVTRKAMEDGSVQIIRFEDIESGTLLKIIEFIRKRVEERGGVGSAVAAAAAGEPTGVGAVGDEASEVGVRTAGNASVEPARTKKPFADEHSSFDSFFREMDMDTLLEAATDLGCEVLQDMSHLKGKMDFARWDEKITLRCRDGMKFSVEHAVAMEMPAIREKVDIGATDILIPDLPTSKILRKAIQYCRKIARTRNRRNPLSLEVAPANETATRDLDIFIGSLFTADLYSLTLLQMTAKCLGLEELKAVVMKAMETCENKLPDENELMLKCLNDDVVFVEDVVALESRTILRLFLENDEDNSIISLPGITSDILNLVIQFCRGHFNARGHVLEVDAFDTSFLMVDSVTFFDLIMAANYLEVPELMSLTQKAFMAMTAPPVRAGPFETYNVEESNLPLCSSKSIHGCTESGAEINKFIILRSMEGKVFEVELAVAMESETIRRRVQDGFSGQVILLIPTYVLHIVLVHCRKRVARFNGPASEKDLNDMENWIVNLDLPTLSELYSAATSLDLKELKRLTSSSIDAQNRMEELIAIKEREAKLSKEVGVVLPPGIGTLEQAQLFYALAKYKAAGEPGIERCQPTTNFPQGQGPYGMYIDRDNAVLAGIYSYCFAVLHSIANPENIPVGLRFKDTSFLRRLLEGAKEARDEILGWGGEPLPLPPDLEEPLSLIPDL